MKFRTLHLLIAAIVLTLSGIVHGMWTNRWAPTDVNEGKNLLEGLGAELGDWKTGDFLKINPAELPANTRCDSRRFMPSKTGKPITVSITSGSPGAVAVHTPDVCYLGAGWKLRGAVSKQSTPLPDGKSASFWVADFTKTNATGSESIRIRWAWTADGNWQAPDYPRWIFARAPILYKLYIVQQLNDDDLTREDPYRKFVADLVPVLSKQLTP
ncbi:MAG: EpsI family protein [Planctomycetes bacterium]|nr:EpsI family protein [Planctomycetota bacterium]